MKWLKYLVIGGLARLLLSLLHGRIPDVAGWVVFGAIVLFLLVLLQRDVRVWLANRKENNNEAVE